MHMQCKKGYVLVKTGISWYTLRYGFSPKYKYTFTHIYMYNRADLNSCILLELIRKMKFFRINIGKVNFLLINSLNIMDHKG